MRLRGSYRTAGRALFAACLVGLAACGGPEEELPGDAPGEEEVLDAHSTAPSESQPWL